MCLKELHHFLYLNWCWIKVSCFCCYLLTFPLLCNFIIGANVLTRSPRKFSYPFCCENFPVQAFCNGSLEFFLTSLVMKSQASVAVFAASPGVFYTLSSQLTVALWCLIYNHSARLPVKRDSSSSKSTQFAIKSLREVSGISIP